MFQVALERIKNNTFTKQDFYSRLGVVQEFLEQALFSSAINTEDLADQCADYARQSGRIESANYIRDWGNDFFNIFTADNLYEAMEELKQEVEELPELVLYTPVSLENKQSEEIGAIAREMFDPEVMINLSVDSKALGGCSFVWQGKFYDFSFNYFLEKNEEAVLELINSYGQK